MTYTVYDPTTGQILYTVTGNDESVQDQLATKTYIDGEYNDRDHYIEITTNTIITKPARPANEYVWDLNTKNWIPDSSRFRQTRNQLLNDVDRVNPIWYASLTQEQQTELQTYRTALLAVPQQSGFPTTIEWPTKPTWL
jgi:hypothetical protein